VSRSAFSITGCDVIYIGSHQAHACLCPLRGPSLAGNQVAQPGAGEVLCEKNQREISRKVRCLAYNFQLAPAYHTPDRWFVYNLSPSFNWSQHGFTGNMEILVPNFDAPNPPPLDVDLKNFVWELAKEG